MNGTRRTDDQREVIAFLSDPRAHGIGASVVERIDTHISIVFLSGTRAYKMKRAVRFPYLDYSTLDRRRTFCAREVRLNRRTAPHIYRAVVAVTREAHGGLALGGAGEPVEWLVEMARFDQDQLLDRLADAGRFDVEMASRLAHAISAFHERAQPRRDCDDVAALRRVLDDNVSEMLAGGPAGFDARRCRALHRASRVLLERHACLMTARRMHGLVRQCHGDLHLHNAVLVDGEPLLFDAIEFNDDLSCIDVAYDVAFLLMDLLHRGLPMQANAALNAWLEERPDYAGLMLLPLFLSCRAAIRAKVSAAQGAVQVDRAAATRLFTEARAYFADAERLLEPESPSLVAIGGFSGSGKSTLAARLAPALGAAPGAVVLRTDTIRKQLCGVDPHARLPSSAYDAATTARVYARMLHAAEGCLRAGHAVILDAVFADAAHRRAAERLAAAAAVSFMPLWLDVPYRTAVERLRGRVADVSDATIPVLDRQIRAGAGALTWGRLDAGGGTEAVAAAALARIRRSAPAALAHP